MGLFDPKWTKETVIGELAKYLTSDQKAELEKIRKDWNLPDETFAMAVMGAPGATRISMEREIVGLRQRYPKISPKQMFALVYKRSQMQAAPSFLEGLRMAAAKPSYQELLRDQWQRDEQNAIENPDQFESLKGVNTIDDLVWLTLDELKLISPDPYGLFDKINPILGLKRRKST